MHTNEMFYHQEGRKEGGKEGGREGEREGRREEGRQGACTASTIRPGYKPFSQFIKRFVLLVNRSQVYKLLVLLVTVRPVYKPFGLSINSSA